MSEDLLLYAQLGYAEHISRLVAEGVDPDWKREDGVTTLMIAALTGRVAILNALLDAGASIDLQSPDGTTALLAATAFARTTREVAGLELLLSRGADPNLANAEGNDALMMAARHALYDAAIVLLNGGADPRRSNRFGTTALMQAARGHLVETARVLIRAGADPMQKDEQGLTALRYAHEVGNPPQELVALLVPSALGGGAAVGRKACRFDTADFRLKLIGSWSDTSEHLGESDAGPWEFTETTGERQIGVTATHLPTALDSDERHDAIARRVKEHMAQLRHDAGECVFSAVRYAEASDAIQARFHATSRAQESYFAVCVYAAPLKFVTLTYRDYRPDLTEDARGRQAGESVASFRVK